MRSSTIRPRNRGLHAWAAGTVAVLLVVSGMAGCTSDPTTSTEYQQLSQQLTDVQAQLASVTSERDALAAAADQSPWVELPAAAADALKHYSDAVLAADGQAMLDYVTDEFTFVSYGDAQDRTTRAAYIDQFYATFKVEVLGDRLVLGGGDTYIVAEPERVTTPALKDGFSVFRLVNRNGTWLVDAHRFTGA